MTGRVPSEQQQIICLSSFIQPRMDPKSGACPCYNVGDTFIFERAAGKDDFWHMGLSTLVKTEGNPDEVAGGPKMPFCSEAWDANTCRKKNKGNKKRL